MSPPPSPPLHDTWHDLGAQVRELSRRARHRARDTVESIVRDAEEYGVPGDQLVRAGRAATADPSRLHPEIEDAERRGPVVTPWQVARQ